MATPAVVTPFGPQATIQGNTVVLPPGAAFSRDAAVSDQLAEQHEELSALHSRICWSLLMNPRMDGETLAAHVALEQEYRLECAKHVDHMINGQPRAG